MTNSLFFNMMSFIIRCFLFFYRIFSLFLLFFIFEYWRKSFDIATYFIVYHSTSSRANRFLFDSSFNMTWHFRATVRVRSKMRVKTKVSVTRRVRMRVRMMPLRASIAYGYVLRGSVGQPTLKFFMFSYDLFYYIASLK
jgi:hypothetical protein